MSKVKLAPTQGEVWVVYTLGQRWPEVLAGELRGRFRGDADDRREDARAMLDLYLLRDAPCFLNRYLPDRDRDAPGHALLADLERVLVEPRGAFRMWVRSMVRYVYRDWCRQRKLQGEYLEVHVVSDGDDERGLTFDRLPVQDERSELSALVNRDQAQDLVALLMEAAPADLQDDIALFLAAESAGEEVYKAHGTSRVAVQGRLRKLREQATALVREVGPWVG